jgi:hypothetical protein
MACRGTDLVAAQLTLVPVAGRLLDTSRSII